MSSATGFVIVRSDGQFVARVGLPHSYTQLLQEAKLFPTEAEALRDVCVENEQVVAISKFFPATPGTLDMTVPEPPTAPTVEWVMDMGLTDGRKNWVAMVDRATRHHVAVRLQPERNVNLWAIYARGFTKEHLPYAEAATLAVERLEASGLPPVPPPEAEEEFVRFVPTSTPDLMQLVHRVHGYPAHLAVRFSSEAKYPWRCWCSGNGGMHSVRADTELEARLGLGQSLWKTLSALNKADKKFKGG